MRAKHILIVDDDLSFATTLERAFVRRGMTVSVCHNTPEALAFIVNTVPDYAVVDLKMPGPSGLECVKGLVDACPGIKIVVLTGYASITTAVETIKLGAVYYLSKPSNADEILAAFDKEDGDSAAPLTTRTASLKVTEWEQIHAVLQDTGFNISETARRLGMHRRTLARKLQKQQVPKS